MEHDEEKKSVEITTFVDYRKSKQYKTFYEGFCKFIRVIPNIKNYIGKRYVCNIKILKVLIELYSIESSYKDINDINMIRSEKEIQDTLLMVNENDLMDMRTLEYRADSNATNSTQEQKYAKASRGTEDPSSAVQSGKIDRFLGNLSISGTIGFLNVYKYIPVKGDEIYFKELVHAYNTNRPKVMYTLYNRISRKCLLHQNIEGYSIFQWVLEYTAEIIIFDVLKYYKIKYKSLTRPGKNNNTPLMLLTSRGYSSLNVVFMNNNFTKKDLFYLNDEGKNAYYYMFKKNFEKLHYIIKDFHITIKDLNLHENNYQYMDLLFDSNKRIPMFNFVKKLKFVKKGLYILDNLQNINLPNSYYVLRIEIKHITLELLKKLELMFIHNHSQEIVDISKYIIHKESHMLYLFFEKNNLNFIDIITSNINIYDKKSLFYQYYHNMFRLTELNIYIRSIDEVQFVISEHKYYDKIHYKLQVIPFYDLCIEQKEYKNTDINYEKRFCDFAENPNYDNILDFIVGSVEKRLYSIIILDKYLQGSYNLNILSYTKEVFVQTIFDILPNSVVNSYISFDNRIIKVFYIHASCGSMGDIYFGEIIINGQKFDVVFKVGVAYAAHVMSPPSPWLKELEIFTFIQKLICSKKHKCKGECKCGWRFVTKMLGWTVSNYSSFIIIDKCESNLLDYVKNTPNVSIPRLVLEIVMGLEVLHKAGIIHRDIKPSNILIRNGHIYISDFGISKFACGLSTRISAKKTKMHASGTRHGIWELIALPACGTPKYMSLMLYNKWFGQDKNLNIQYEEPLEPKRVPYNELIDIWSLGITILVMLDPNHFENYDKYWRKHKLGENIYRMAFIPMVMHNINTYVLDCDHIPEEWKQILTKCIFREIDDRCSAEVLVDIIKRSFGFDKNY